MDSRGLVTYPDPILRAKTAKIKRFGASLERLASRMYSIMKQSSGVGLAGPQIGESLSIAVVEIPENKKEKVPFIPKLVLINPKIVRLGKLKDRAVEGCLSLPDVEVEVKRNLWVEVDAQDLSGARTHFRAEGFFARVIQHEIDHLNGILIIDHGPPVK